MACCVSRGEQRPVLVRSPDMGSKSKERERERERVMELIVGVLGGDTVCTMLVVEGGRRSGVLPRKVDVFRFVRSAHSSLLVVRPDLLGDAHRFSNDPKGVAA